MANYGKRMVPEYLIKGLEEAFTKTSGGTGSTINLMENIVDSKGNKRFIEGTGTLSPKAGVTSSYIKWSLSGTHLMFVAFGNIENATELAIADLAIDFSIPKWIFDKIKTIQGSANGRVEMKEVKIYNSGLSSSQTLQCSLYKNSNDNIIRINNFQSLTTNDSRIYIIQFDVLIDSE